MAIVYPIRLSFAEEQILKHFISLIEKEIPEAQQMILYGSRARGDSDEDSDLDIAVILDVPHIDKKMWDRLWDIKWRVLEPLKAEEFPLSLTLISMNDVMSRDFGIEKVIKEKGIVVWKRKN